MNCACGEILGFLFKCVKCDGSCCIYCTPTDINIEICPKCYTIEKEYLEKKEIEKKEIKKKQDKRDINKKTEKTEMPICKFTDCHNTIFNRKCGNCSNVLEYCYSHVNYCNDTTAKSKGSNKCKLPLCPTHLRCKHHPNTCSVCKKDLTNINITNINKCSTCHKSKTCDDIKCIETNFPLHDLGYYICKTHYHFSRCGRCDKVSCRVKCNFANCPDHYLCFRCNLISYPSHILEKPLSFYVSRKTLKKFSTYKQFVVLCDNHKQKCSYCDSMYPKITLVLPSKFDDWYCIDYGHPQRKYKGCPKCFNSTLTGIENMQKYLTAKNIILPKDIKRMIFSKINTKHK